MTPVAFLHGFTGSPRSWDGVAARLPAGSRLHAPWLLGHGSPSVEAPGLSTFAEEVDRLAANLRLLDGPLHLVGYSLGARLALGLLVRHGELFAAATLVGAQPGLATEDERGERQRADAVLSRMLTEQGLEAFVSHWETLPLFRTQQDLPATDRAARRGERLGHTAQGLARSLAVTGLGVMPDHREALTSVTVPTLLVAGELDVKFTALARGLASTWPAARVAIVPGAGHDVGLEDPGHLARLITRTSGTGDAS